MLKPTAPPSAGPRLSIGVSSMKAKSLAFLIFVSFGAHASDISQLYGITPGTAIANLKQPYPTGGFPSFRAPAIDKNFKKVFPDAGIAVLPPNVAVSISAGRAFSSMEECMSASRDLRSQLAPFFPGKATRPWDAMSADKKIGLSLGCSTTEESPYFELHFAITHIETADKFRAMLNDRGS